MLRKLSDRTKPFSQWIGIVVVLYLAARLMIGSDWRLVSLIGSILPWIAFLSLFLLIVSLVLHRRWRLVALHIPVLISFGLIYGDLYRPQAPAAIPDNSLPLSIATYNIYSKSSDVAEITEVIRSMDADVIGLQEVGLEHAIFFEEHLQAEYPHQVFYPLASNLGLGVLSRYPLENETLLLTYEDVRGDTKNGLLRVEADIDGITIAIFVAHPPPPSVVTLEMPPVIYDEQPRDEQLQTLKDLVIQESFPVLALCDCNVTDQNGGYQILDSVLDDSFQEAGRGLGFTVAPRPMSIPAIFPLLWRIDYVWHDSDFVVSEAVVVDDGGTSDHRAIVVQMHVSLDGATNGNDG